MSHQKGCGGEITEGIYMFLLIFLVIVSYFTSSRMLSLSCWTQDHFDGAHSTIQNHCSVTHRWKHLEIHLNPCWQITVGCFLFGKRQKPAGTCWYEPAAQRLFWPLKAQVCENVEKGNHNNKKGKREETMPSASHTEAAPRFQIAPGGNSVSHCQLTAVRNSADRADWI